MLTAAHTAGVGSVCEDSDVNLVAINAAIVWLRLCSNLFYLLILPVLRKTSLTCLVRFTTFDSSVAMVSTKYSGRGTKEKKEKEKRNMNQHFNAKR